MNDDEKIAETYLKTCIFDTVQYEPIRNKTPDFLCDNDIAVEVRRLNFLEKKTTGTLKGCEDSAIPMLMGIESVLKKFGEVKNKPAWWLACQFERPLMTTRDIKKTLEERIRTGLKTKVYDNIEIIINKDHLQKFKLIRSGQDFDDGTIKIGIISDYDIGGLVMEKTKESLLFCIKEKDKNAKNADIKYKKWWLILVDYLYSYFDDDEIDELRKSIDFDMIFERVIVLNHSTNTPIFDFKNPLFLD